MLGSGTLRTSRASMHSPSAVAVLHLDPFMIFLGVDRLVPYSLFRVLPFECSPLTRFWSSSRSWKAWNFLNSPLNDFSFGARKTGRYYAPD